MTLAMALVTVNDGDTVAPVPYLTEGRGRTHARARGSPSYPVNELPPPRTLTVHSIAVSLTGLFEADKCC